MWVTILLFLYVFFHVESEKLFNLFIFVGTNFCMFSLFCENLLHHNNQIFKVELWYFVFILVTDLFGCFRGLFYVIKQLDLQR